ncbi:quinone-dependent dihydroorotate dehydrogenase [soil metagenome]
MWLCGDPIHICPAYTISHQHQPPPRRGKVTLAAFGCNARYYRSMYESLIRPALFKMDPERAHDLAHKFAPLLAFSPFHFEFSAPNLSTKLSGVELKNPIGLAAGCDKNGRFVEFVDRLGFGFVEVGSVCAQATKGNAKPRLFRLPEDNAVINRLGLNGDGAEAVAARLAAVKFALPTGLNIAKTNLPEIQGDKAIADVLTCFEQVKGLPLAYVAFNASCPNTHEGILNERQQLNDIMSEVQKKNVGKLPVYIKMSPDSSEELISDIVEIGCTHDLAGFICGNTSLSREGLRTDAARIAEIGNGGLSGTPLKPRALALVQRVAKIKSASHQIIACGGIASGTDAFEFLESGATALQLYTGLVYHGPTLVAKVNRELSTLLAQKDSTRNDAQPSISS